LDAAIGVATTERGSWKDDLAEKAGSLRVSGEISPQDHQRLLGCGWRGVLHRGDYLDPEHRRSGRFRKIRAVDPRSVVEQANGKG
jgi:hypothetical protein